MASRKIEDCSLELQEVWNKGKEIWIKTYPNLPIPFLTCTHRSNDEQTVLYNQPTDGIDNNNNGKIDEPGECVTHAKAGQSFHNSYPSKAFDLGFKNKDGSLNWNLENFSIFSKIAKSINSKIIWGGDWSKEKRDNPHYEIH